MSLSRIARVALLSALCAPTVAIAPVSGQEPPLGNVEVEGGLVQGVLSDHEGVTAFLGIPFAGNVGGENRWRPAPPVEPWEGVLVADTQGPKMLQDFDPQSDPLASDDGLNLNIWTPAQSPDEKLPVYMLIHGGANRTGSAQYDDLQAEELASQGIVVVSVQYRLGAPGFLALPELAQESGGAVGNYAVLDLIDALEWIRDNIERFGGNPDMVTFGGQSAGGENSVALLRTPIADGLYQRAFIASSFTGFLPGKIVDGATKMEQNQAALDELFGKPTTIADLRAIPEEDWIASFGGRDQSLYNQMAGAVATNQFYTIDGHTLTADSVDLLQPGALEGIDIMIGQTADERTGLNGDPEGVMSPEEYRTEVMKLATARSYMAGGESDEVFDLYVPMTDLDAYRLWVRMQNDRMFEYVRIGAEYAQAHNDDTKVYLYYWDHAPPGNEEGFRGAYHAADNYFFTGALDASADDQRPWTDPDIAMEKLAMLYLANFIKTGNPNGEGLPEWGPVTEESDGQFMRFNQGEAEMRTQTIYPSRDDYHRRMVLEGLDWTDADVFGE